MLNMWKKSKRLWICVWLIVKTQEEREKAVVWSLNHLKLYNHQDVIYSDVTNEVQKQQPRKWKISNFNTN